VIQLPPEVIGKALADADYRTRLFDDPKGALEELGVDATDDLVGGIQGLDRAAVESFVASLGDAVGDNAAG